MWVVCAVCVYCMQMFRTNVTHVDLGSVVCLKMLV